MFPDFFFLFNVFLLLSFSFLSSDHRCRRLTVSEMKGRVNIPDFIFVLLIILGSSGETTRPSGLLSDFVDCASLLKEASAGPGDARSSATEDDYAEIYYEDRANRLPGSTSGEPICLCSEDFSEVHCSALTDNEGNSLFLPGAIYGSLASLRSDFSQQDKLKSLNKTSSEDPLLLSSFHLKKNSVKSMLPRNILQSMKFQRVVFSFNEIGNHLGHNLFFSKETLEAVEVLEMGKCDLGSILPRRLLRGSKKLRRLYLWGNRIKTFPPNFFSDSRSLSELVLCGNSISNLDELTFGGIDQFKNLKLLDLDKNGITSLQGIKFRDRFKQNSEFSGHSFSMSFDEKEEAPLSRVIGNKLETLKLGGNSIHTLPGGFLSDLKYLKFLKLDNNGLSYVYPGAFDGLQSLVRLSLAWNMIGYLPDDIFAQMSHLLILELQGNRLEHLWFRTFRGLSSLQTLDLSKNRLSALAEGLFQHSPSLIRIDLSHNQLQFLDECSFHRPIHRLQSVSLVDNPIVCSCTLSWLWRYTESADRHQDQTANSTMEAIRSTGRLQIRPSFREDSGLQHRRRRHHLRPLHHYHHHHHHYHNQHHHHHNQHHHHLRHHNYSSRDAITE